MHRGLELGSGISLIQEGKLDPGRENGSESKEYRFDPKDSGNSSECRVAFGMFVMTKP